MKNKDSLLVFLVLAAVVATGAGLFFLLHNGRLDDNDFMVFDRTDPLRNSGAAEIINTAQNKPADWQIPSDLPKAPAVPPPIKTQENVSGPNKAVAQMIIYDNLAEPFALDFARFWQKAQEEFGEQINLVFRPYFENNDEEALIGALALACAAAERKNWEMLPALLSAKQSGPLTLDKAGQIGQDLKLSKAFPTCLQDTGTKQQVLAEVGEARSAWVTGAPTFFLNGKIYVGAYPYEDFTRSDGTREKGLKNLLEAVLAEAQTS